MANYKQNKKDHFDQLTYDYMSELADDYRRSGKLLEFRSKQGVQKVREQLNKM
jgi:hypothetical protein